MRVLATENGPEKPDTGDLKLRELPGVLVDLEGWRRKLQCLLQHNDIMTQV